MYFSSVLCKFFEKLSSHPLNDEDLCLFCLDFAFMVILCICITTILVLIKTRFNPTYYLDIEDGTSSLEMIETLESSTSSEKKQE
jgi:type IV secretory pathway component VirB8